MNAPPDAMRIRDETPADWAAIEDLHRRAFGGELEANLVARLRHDDLVACALVADERGAIVGHIVFSWLEVQVDRRDVRAMALAPLAVRPDRQRRGIGSELARAGLAAARAAGGEAVIVLGHPAYYPRFGFSSALAAKLRAPFKGDAFMALELVLGALAGASGAVIYPQAFGIPAGKTQGGQANLSGR